MLVISYQVRGMPYLLLTAELISHHRYRMNASELQVGCQKQQLTMA
jgi:hypothetical protein